MFLGKELFSMANYFEFVEIHHLSIDRQNFILKAFLRNVCNVIL
jgi:hypothetical protein